MGDPMLRHWLHNATARMPILVLYMGTINIASYFYARRKFFVRRVKGILESIRYIRCGVIVLNLSD